mmetsp:Transcript_7268/g.20625  ORF Transcript_7268/g.20625 Transcript_7268/m.20625 type:complete len:764 (-) Transcript_7268:59-2350(-)
MTQRIRMLVFVLVLSGLWVVGSCNITNRLSLDVKARKLVRHYRSSHGSGGMGSAGNLPSYESNESDMKIPTLLVEFYLRTPAGGLNNKLMSTFYFLLLAKEERAKFLADVGNDGMVHVLLPNIGPHRFDSIFDLEYFRANVQQHHGIIVEVRRVQHSSSAVIRTDPMDQCNLGAICRELYAFLRPSKEIDQIVSDCTNRIGGLYTAVHFRLEKDYQKSFCKSRESHYVGDPMAPRVCYSASHIIDQVVATPEINTIHNVIVIGGAPMAGHGNPSKGWPAEWNATSKVSLGCVPPWKGEATHDAVVDFFLGTRARYWVGQTTSTMSNGVAMWRSGVEESTVGGSPLPSLVHDCPQHHFETLILRGDKGERANSRNDSITCTDIERYTHDNFVMGDLRASGGTVRYNPSRRTRSRPHAALSANRDLSTQEYSGHGVEVGSWSLVDRGSPATIPAAASYVIEPARRSLQGGFGENIMVLVEYVRRAMAYASSRPEERALLQLPRFHGEYLGEYFDFNHLARGLVRGTNLTVDPNDEHFAHLPHIRIDAAELCEAGTAARLVLSSLEPSYDVRLAVDECLRAARTKFGDDHFNVVHFRLEVRAVEEDCVGLEGEGEGPGIPRTCFKSSDIIAQVQNSPAVARVRRVYAMGGPPARLRGDPLEGWGDEWQVLSKDSLQCVPRDYNEMRRAAVDFFVAAEAATNFVGRSTSALSNGVTIKRSMSPSIKRNSNYVYDCPQGDFTQLVLRRDHGERQHPLDHARTCSDLAP